MIVVRASAQPSVPLASGKLLGASVNARTAVTVPKPVGPRYRVRVEGDTSVAADKAPAPLKLVAEISGHPDQAEIFSGIKGLVPPIGPQECRCPQHDKPRNTSPTVSTSYPSVLNCSLKECPPTGRSGNANHADHLPTLRAELIRVIDNILLARRADQHVFPLLT